jgi:hypothetical protein
MNLPESAMGIRAGNSQRDMASPGKGICGTLACCTVTVYSLNSVVGCLYTGEKWGDRCSEDLSLGNFFLRGESHCAPWLS